MIIGLDISGTNTGFSIVTDDKTPVEVGYIPLESVSSTIKSLNIFYKTDEILRIVTEKLNKYGIKKIIIEAPLDVVTGTNVVSGVILNRLNYSVVYSLYRLGYEIEYVSSQHARKLFMGDDYKVWIKLPKGDYKKEYIVEKVEPFINKMIEFKYRPRAKEKHLAYLYDVCDAYVISIAF